MKERLTASLMKEKIIVIVRGPLRVGRDGGIGNDGGHAPHLCA